MRYKVLTGICPFDLNQKVERHLDDKWQLQGGVTIAGISEGLEYAQAVTTNNMSIPEDEEVKSNWPKMF